MLIQYIIMTVIILPFPFMMYSFYSKTVKYRNGEIFLVSIPYEHKDNDEIIDLSSKASRLLKIFLILSLLIIFVGNLLNIVNYRYMLIIILMQTLIPVMIEILYLSHYRNRVLKIKQENNWNSPLDIFVDTRLLNSKLNNKYNKYFHSSLIFFLVTVVLYVLNNNELTILLLFSTTNIFLFTLIMKSEDYIYVSENFEENYDYNLKKIDENIKLIKGNIFINLIFFVIYLISSFIFEKRILFYIFIVVMLSLCLTLIFFIMKLYRIGKKYEVNKNNIAYSGDFYDYLGYKNPYDNRISVPDKFIGTTINRGNTKGRIVYYMLNIFVVILLIVTQVYL